MTRSSCSEVAQRWRKGGARHCSKCPCFAPLRHLRHPLIGGAGWSGADGHRRFVVSHAPDSGPQDFCRRHWLASPPAAVDSPDAPGPVSDDLAALGRIRGLPCGLLASRAMIAPLSSHGIPTPPQSWPLGRIIERKQPSFRYRLAVTQTAGRGRRSYTRRSLFSAGRGAGSGTSRSARVLLQSRQETGVREKPSSPAALLLGPSATCPRISEPKFNFPARKFEINSEKPDENAPHARKSIGLRND
jgi:hypothetical protein